MALTILISQNDSEWADELKRTFISSSYHAEVTNNGRDCQLRAYKHKCFGLILDIDTKSNSGLEVLKYFRLSAPSVKVVLTFESKKRFEELEFSKEELLKMGASDIIIRPCSNDKLVKSIEGVGQFEAWKNLKVTDDKPHHETELNESDNKFTRVKISEYTSGNMAIFDLYVRIASNKYIKIFKGGERIDHSRINHYAKEKGVEFLYFKTADRGSYINFMNQLLEKTISSSASVDKKIAMLKNVSEKFIEEVHTVGLKPALIDEGKKLCENVYDLARRDVNLNKLMNTYIDSTPNAMTHSFLVSFFSAVICKNLEWGTKRTIETISFGALLHDLGKVKLPIEIRSQSFSKLSVGQREKYCLHPIWGVEMLQAVPMITEPIKQIVYQHHEYVNGEGYPNRLSGSRIYPLAKVVSLANEFADLIIDEKITPIEGIKRFIPDRQKTQCFDPQVIKALVMGFTKDR